MRIVIKLDYQGAITGPGNFNREAFKGVNLRICQNDRDRAVYLSSSLFSFEDLKDLGAWFEKRDRCGSRIVCIFL